MDSLKHSKNYRSMNSEVIDLEANHFTEARQMSQLIVNEAQQWQGYLSALGLLGFKSWLNQRVSDLPVLTDPIQPNPLGITYLKVGQFKYCLILTEFKTQSHQMVLLSKIILDDPKYFAHFYVFLEVLEEAEEVIITGFIRHDQLIKTSLNKQDSFYCISQKILDPEPNHLLLYTRYLKPNAIPFSTQTAIEMTQLRGWLQGVFTSAWQTVDEVLNPPQAQLGWSFRGYQSPMAAPTNLNSTPIRRCKLLQSQIEQNQSTIALVIALTPTDSAQLNIAVEVHGIKAQENLPPDLQLLLMDETGETVMQAQANQAKQTQRIELLFSAELGDQFTVKIRLNEIIWTEVFEI